MAKNFALIDASKVISKRPCITNWNLCVLCQLDTNAALECPARSTRPTSGSGYKSLAEHLIQFQSLGHVPMDIDINMLDDGDGIEATLMRHQACWHKTCRLNFNQTKLDRLNKKVVQEENEISIQTRSNHNKVDLKDATCLRNNTPIAFLREQLEPISHNQEKSCLGYVIKPKWMILQI